MVYRRRSRVSKRVVCRSWKCRGADPTCISCAEVSRPLPACNAYLSVAGNWLLHDCHQQRVGLFRRPEPLSRRPAHTVVQQQPMQDERCGGWAIIFSPPMRSWPGSQVSPAERTQLSGREPMRAIKIAGIVIGGVLAVLLITLVAVWLFVNPNDYKGRIAKAVRDSTGRELNLPGDIRLSVFPWIALEFGPASSIAGLFGTAAETAVGFTTTLATFLMISSGARLRGMRRFGRSSASASAPDNIRALIPARRGSRRRSRSCRGTARGKLLV